MTDSLSKSQRAFLRRLFGRQDCLLESQQVYPYGADASRQHAAPLAVVRPQNLEQCRELMAWAQREDMPIYPRGRATNVVGACVPHPPGVVVSTLKLNRIIEIDPDDFVAVVEPGVVTNDIQTAAAAQKLFYPPDPASVRSSSIGGNVATCAGGMRALKYGVTREYVLGLEAVLPGGRVITPGGRTHKNVVGLDLVRLLVGSEGSLALTTKITLKLLPLPESTASLLVGCASLDTCLAVAKSVFAAGILPTAMELMAAEVLTAIANVTTVPWPNSVQAALLLKLDGAVETLPPAMRRLREIVERHSPEFLAEGAGAVEEELWELRRLINPASYSLAPDKMSDDVTVPRGTVVQAIKGVQEIARSHGLIILVFGHLGDGNLHVNIMYDATLQQKEALAAKQEVHSLVLSLRGSLSGEHGVGTSKKPYVGQQLGQEQINLMRQIKAAFDPTGIMNPGKGF